MNYFSLTVLVSLLFASIWHFIRSIPANFYLVKGQIIRWEKKKVNTYFFEYFPVVEYSDKSDQKNTVEFKGMSVGCIKPRSTYSVTLLVDKNGARLASNVFLNLCFILASVFVLVVLLVGGIKEL